jgi:WhiB family redox-sensing transcriptional regulator
MPVADKPDRHAVIARIANEAHANGERAADALMARFAMSDRTATKVMSLARKAGHTIARDPDRRTPEQLAEWRRSTLIGWFDGSARMFDPMPWKELANCKGVDPDLFFPEQGTNRIQIDQAKTVCRGCEVRIECFEYAMKHLEKGVWGGTSEIQRRRIRAGWLRFEDCA